ncbi:hypothetical protein CFRA_10050 [Corynebacterium frankenforstense DSM 45800]|uniref:HTH lacI-type domain-containing protein n=1 Tax=Corynebacterium frankenforstense DSM 45800 TaxID=1437875 RepID=A0A1L7CUN7_9CORY|nr:LacI family DNA-binding transcriptional regulator [Corynebacterium frankenforstense]APT89518.1 hypothetical protein CFRA_10050 [Corynebacterium frankenforstense DSM 45800]
MSSKPSLKAVAELAGVGYGTASRALTGNGYVSPQTREKVLAAAHELDYRPNILAKALREDRTNLVGVILPDLLNEFYSDATQVIHEELTAAGYQMIVAAAADAAEQDAVVDSMIQHRVAGVIQVPVPGARATDEAPLVQLNRSDLGTDVAAVVCDERDGFARLGRLALRPGERAVVLLGQAGLSTTRARLAGLERAAEEVGAELEVRHGVYTATSGYDLTAEVLKDPASAPGTLIAASPRLMAGAVRCLCDRGLQVPEDMRLAGFDDPEWYRFFGPGITAFVPPHREMGKAAVKMLLGLMRGESGGVVRLDGEVVERGSLG